ncbi:uncharacterized protein LOC132189035 [Corylus avellana]|uniref:uncharacterized protein LOC132189035 n=1 Tax=Corylus avellana TaxID=13451 RepID=UPI00286C4C59|nr:uncharacterized protein LOC132189035 [Corylus avellana]
MSQPSQPSASEISGDANPPIAEVRPTEADTTPADEVAAVVGNTTKYWEVIGGIRSIFTPAIEGFLRNNYDIPSTVVLHFPSPSSSPLANLGEVCVYERMLKAGLRFPLPRIARELLCHLGVAPFQIAPNGWRFLIACYLLWPEANPGHEMSVEEFLKVYRPMPLQEVSGVLSFTAREKLQVIGLGGTYTNNKDWHKEFFFVSGDWECLPDEDLSQVLRIPRSCRPLHKEMEAPPSLTRVQLKRVANFISFVHKHLKTPRLAFKVIVTDQNLRDRLHYSIPENKVLWKRNLKKKKALAPKKQKKKKKKALAPKRQKTLFVNARKPAADSPEKRAASKAAKKTATEASKKRALEGSKKPIAESPKKTVGDRGKTDEPSQTVVKDKGKRKAGDALPRITIAGLPQAPAKTSLRLLVELEDPDFPLKRKKAKKAEASLRTVGPEVNLEAERSESGSGAENLNDDSGAERPDSGSGAERPEASSGAETYAPAVPTPVVRAFTNVLSGARRLLNKNLTIQEVLLEGRPSRPSTVTLLDGEPLLVAPSIAMPLSSASTEVVHLSASESDTESDTVSSPDLEHILRDLAAKAPLIEPLAMAIPEQTESSDPSVIPETSCSKLNPEPVISEPVATEPTATVIEAVVTEPVTTEPMTAEPTSAVAEAEENQPTDPRAGGEPMNIEEPTQLHGNNPEPISWTFGEPLSQLGEDWLGNPFSALVSLIPPNCSAGGSIQPPKEVMEQMLYHQLNGSMKCLDYYISFRKSTENSASDTKALKKRLEDSDAEVTRLRERSAQQDNELLLLGERIVLLEAQSARVSEHNTEAESQIQELETGFAAAQARFKRLLTDYSALEDEASQIKEKHAEVELQCRASKARINSISEELQEAQKEALVQCARAESAEEKLKTAEERQKVAEEKASSFKGKFCRAKEQVCRYKGKARIFYKQLSFASWARDSGWGLGYITGFETFRDWVKNPSNLINLYTVNAEDVPPAEQAIEEVASIGQKEMPDCKGITFFGYNPFARSEVVGHPEAKEHLEPEEHSDDNDSSKSVYVSEEEWDFVSDGAESPNT